MSVRYQLSPELGDGLSYSIADNSDQLLRAVFVWCREFGSEPGESFSVQTVEMTDKEVEALPEV